MIAVSSCRPLAEDLHAANARLRSLLDSIATSAGSDATVRVVSPEQMASLLSELIRAGQWLRTLPADREPALEYEIGDYRKTVKRLQELLPAVHRTLLGERARLERERTRMESTAEWVRRSQQTL